MSRNYKVVCLFPFRLCILCIDLSLLSSLLYYFNQLTHIAMLFSSLPSYSPSKRMCSLTWHSSAPQDEALAIVLLVISFVIPTLVLISVYTGVFRVAKRAACGVAPQQIATIASFATRAAAVEPSSISATDNVTRVQQGGSLFPMKPLINVQQATPSCSTGNVIHAARACPSPSNNYENEDSGIKTNSYPSISEGKHRKGISNRQKKGYNPKTLECDFPCGCRPNLHPRISPLNEEARQEARVQALQCHGKTHSRCALSCTQSWTASNSPSAACYKVRPSHVKAFKTLLVIVFTHFFLWCPFFVCQLYELSQHRMLSLSLDAAVTWLSFLSYAVNPCLYGCLNRGIRGELVRQLSHVQYLCCCYLFSTDDHQGRSSVRCGWRVPCKPRAAETSSECGNTGDQPGAAGAESFLQFLQRTRAEDEC